MDLLYPRRCPVCQDLITAKEEHVRICTECEKKLPYVREPRCMKCGKELYREEQEYCLDCVREPKHYKRGYPVFVYQAPVKAGVMAFKYHNRREYAEFYTWAMLKRYEGEYRRFAPDGILPVPMYPRKQRRRGYNQAELLAKGLGAELKIPVFTELLRRRIDTVPQKELNDKERINNLKKAFHISGNDVKLKRILLVDDIYTTGATIEACAEVLLQAGVKEVCYTSICIGKGDS